MNCTRTLDGRRTSHNMGTSSEHDSKRDNRGSLPNEDTSSGSSGISANDKQFTSWKNRLRVPERYHVPQRWRAWHMSVGTGACLAFFTFAANTGLLIWAERMAISSTSDGLLQVFEGNCAHASTAVTWAHMAINVLSTLLLYASSTGMELASAPSREEVDDAHARGIGVDIGILSLRNLDRVRSWKVAAWLMLAISSLPLHLLYNSVVFQTTSANDITYALVSSDFPQGAPFNHSFVLQNGLVFGEPGYTPYSYSLQPGTVYRNGSYVYRNYDNQTVEMTVYGNVWPDSLQQMQQQIDSLTRMSRPDCIKKFLNPFVSDYGFLLLVSDAPSTGDSVLSLSGYNASEASSNLAQICSTRFLPFSEPAGFHGGCNTGAQKKDTGSWQLPVLNNKPNYLIQDRGNLYQAGRAGIPTVNVDYCLARPAKQQCTVQISRWLLLPVILCNGIKFMVLAMLALKDMPGEPLVTVGDALASFLSRPDPSMRLKGPISAAQVRECWRQAAEVSPSRYLSSVGPTMADVPPKTPWKQKRRRFFRVPSTTRCILTFLAAFFIWAFALACMVIYGEASVPAYFREGLETIDSQYMISATIQWSIAPVVVLVNLPQLAVSIVYMSFYSIFACMLEAREFASYAQQRLPLRVSHPRGEQICTWWLQLPFVYAIPLMGLLTLLHWLISESIFLVRVAVIDSNGVRQTSEDLNGCGWSPMAVFLSLIIGGVIILSFFAMGLRRLAPGAPLVGCCSIAIAAACADADRDELNHGRKDLVFGKLMYGVVEEYDLPRNGADGRVGFTNGHVWPLVHGKVYE